MLFFLDPSKPLDYPILFGLQIVFQEKVLLELCQNSLKSSPSMIWALPLSRSLVCLRHRWDTVIFIFHLHTHTQARMRCRPTPAAYISYCIVVQKVSFFPQKTLFSSKDDDDFVNASFSTSLSKKFHVLNFEGI